MQQTCCEFKRHTQGKRVLYQLMRWRKILFACALQASLQALGVLSELHPIAHFSKQKLELDSCTSLPGFSARATRIRFAVYVTRREATLFQKLLKFLPVTPLQTVAIPVRAPRTQIGQRNAGVLAMVLQNAWAGCLGPILWHLAAGRALMALLPCTSMIALDAEIDAGESKGDVLFC